MAFADNLKALRKRDGITQEELAAALNQRYGEGFCRSSIAKWERGLHLPPAYTVKRLAEYFEVTSDFLIGVEQEPFEQALQRRPALRNLVESLIDADDEKINALCLLAGTPTTTTTK